MSYSRVVLATDLSDGSLAAAKAVRPFVGERAQVRAILVLPESWPAGEPADGAARARRDEAVTMLRAWCDRAGVPDAEPVVVTGSPAREIAREAEGSSADLVILGHRGAHRRRVLGSTARHILRSVATDTLVVRPRSSANHAASVVAVATDFSGPSIAAAGRAAAIAKERAATIELLHCIDPAAWYDPGVEPDAASVAQALHRFNEAHFAGRAKVSLLRGRPAREIPRQAAVLKADLVVLGNHGGGAIERALLGSVAEAVAEKAHCSVLVVRA